MADLMFVFSNFRKNVWTYKKNGVRMECMVIQKIVTDTFYVGITVEMETNRVAIRV